MQSNTYQIFNEQNIKYIIKTYGSGKNKSAILKKVTRLDIELNTKDLRTYMYDNGFVLDGNKYVYFMRSTSKSRGGNMLFVKEEFFYELLVKWARLGILGVEMESAGLYVNAAAAGKKALGIFTVSDHLLRDEATTAEERQNSFTQMMEIALEIAE